MTGLWRRAGWPHGLRFIARRVKPSRRHAKNLTDFEKKTGWRYQLIVTNIDNLGRSVPGSHHAYFLDTLHRQHAVVEDRVRTEKATGLRRLPFHGYERNTAWLLAANIACDLLAYLQLLGLQNEGELAAAEPETLRATILHIPARTSRAQTPRSGLKPQPAEPASQPMTTPGGSRLGNVYGYPSPATISLVAR